MAATLGLLKGQLLVQVADGAPVQICAFDIPITATLADLKLGGPIASASIDLRAAVADALEAAAAQLRE